MSTKQEKPNNTEWKKRFDKNNRPHNSNHGMMDFWQDFWPGEVLQMFGDFSNELSEKYDCALTHISYTVMYGWKFSYSSAIVLVKNVHIFDDCFAIDGIIVRNREDYKKALAHVASLYTDEFLEKRNEFITKRNKKQAVRSRRLTERRKNELNKILESTPSEKLNKYKWSPKISRHEIKRLYDLNAKHIYDEELVDKVGYTLYARCLQGRDEAVLNLNNKKLRCHKCEKIHVPPENGFILCSCGYAYIYSEYRKSFQRERMPSGAATPFFNEFINKWERAKTYHEKMLAIDYIIHECHLNMISNVKRGFAGCNLIEGTKKQVSEFILELAYGDIVV